MIRIYIQDIGMGFGIGKYVILSIKSGKRQKTEEIELPNQERLKTKFTSIWEYWKRTPNTQRGK